VQDVDLYKFYLDISVKAALFVFGISGALVSYFFSSNAKDVVVYALVFPLILNVGFFVLFHASIKASSEMRDVHKQTSKALEGVEAYDMEPLPSVCRILSYMYLLAAAGLAALLIVYIS